MWLATHGIIASSSQVAPPAFANNYSLEFDGVNDYVETDSVFTTLNGVTKASFSMWVKPTTVSSLKAKQVFQIGRGSTGSNCQCNLWLFQDNRIEFNVNSSTNYVRGDISSINYDSWNHILITVDLTLSSNHGKIYVNGVDETTTQTVGNVSSFPNATDELYIGESKTGQYHPFLGNIDEFGIFANTVLSSSDATAIYNAGTPESLDSYSPDHYYRFEEGSGTATVDSAGSADATLTNGVTYSTDVPTFTNNYSLSFDGVDDNVKLNSNTQNFTDFSLSFWCIKGSGNYKSIVGSNSSSEGGILKAIVLAGGSVRYHDSSSSWTSLTGTLSSTVWNHVLITYDSSSNTLKGYQDGSLTATINPSFSGWTTNAHSIRYIGARYNTGFFNDLMDEVAMWDSVINIGDVWDGSGSATDLSSTNPVHWWRFEEGSGTTVNDSGSGNIDGTIINGATYSTDKP